jgi:hypothetical protein
MTSSKAEAFMWTQNFNFKLNVYTNEYNQTMRTLSGPNHHCCWDGGGGVRILILSHSQKLWLRTKITNITPKSRTAAPLSWPCSHYSVSPDSVQNLTRRFPKLSSFPFQNLWRRDIISRVRNPFVRWSFESVNCVPVSTDNFSLVNEASSSSDVIPINGILCLKHLWVYITPWVRNLR